MPRPDHTRALHAALLTAARGLPVIPLSRTKLPAVRSPHRDEPRSAVMCRGECGRPGHGVHDATTDPARIRALFAVAPWATGYGVACGRGPHHLIGLDLDVKHGADGIGALRVLAGTHGFTVPDTVTVLTPSGGRHLWLTAPGPVPNSAGRLAPGIDVRGEGGYVVGPGSRTVAGRYLLAPGGADRPLAAAPAVLLRLAVPRPRPTSGRPGTRQGRGTPPRSGPRPWCGSCWIRTKASATGGCSGPPAVPTTPASATSWRRPW